MDDPRVYVQIVRKFNLGDYESIDVTIGLSQIPATAGDGLIREMLRTSGRAFEMIAADVAEKGQALREEIVRSRVAPADAVAKSAKADAKATSPASSAFLKKVTDHRTNEDLAGKGPFRAAALRLDESEKSPDEYDETPGEPAPESGLYGIRYSMPLPPKEEHFSEMIHLSQIKTVKGLLAKAFGKNVTPAGFLLQGLVCGIGKREKHIDYECKTPEQLTRGEAVIIIDWLSQATEGHFEDVLTEGEAYDPFDEGAEVYRSQEGLVRAGS